MHHQHLLGELVLWEAFRFDNSLLRSQTLHIFRHTMITTKTIAIVD